MEQPTFENVLYDVDDSHVAHIVINHPERHNVLTLDTIADIDSAMRLADDDEDVHVIILTGAGKSFSAGHDLSGRSREPKQGWREARPGSVEARYDLEEKYLLRGQPDHPQPAHADHRRDQGRCRHRRDDDRVLV